MSKCVCGFWKKDCEVITRDEKCGNVANFKVRHKHSLEAKSFLVCKDCILPYKHETLGSMSFIVKEVSE